MKWILEITNFNFWKKLKNLFELRDQKWWGDQPLKTKNFEDMWQFKISSWYLVFKNQETNLDIPGVFDNHFTKYLIYKVSWMHWQYF